MIYWVPVAALLICCTRQDVIKTGVSSPYFEGTIMEYLRSDLYNWEHTVKAIEHAGLTDLFEGEDTEAREITFFGVTSYSVQRFVWNNRREEITDFPKEQVRALLLKHVVKGKYLKKDIAYRDPSFLIMDEKQTGGTEFTCMGGNKVRAYVDKSSYEGVPDAGAEILRLYSISAMTTVPMASPDIQPRNGVVHALNYNYEFGNI